MRSCGTLDGHEIQQRSTLPDVGIHNLGLRAPRYSALALNDQVIRRLNGFWAAYLTRASTIRAASTFSRTLWTRTISTLQYAAIAVMAAVPPSRACGGPPST